MQDHDVFTAFSKEVTLCHKIGFLWPSHKEIISQIRSELLEIEESLAHQESSERITEELGDLIDACFWLIHHLGFDPKATSLKGITKITQRIQMLQQLLKEKGHTENVKLSIDQLLQYWDEVKVRLKKA